MRIYGGKDYYDCGLAYGVDPAIVLLRSNEKFDVRKHGTLIHGANLRVIKNGREEVILYKLIRVAFGSKIYQGIGINAKDGWHYFWNEEKLNHWLSENPEYEVQSTTYYWERKTRSRKYMDNFFKIIDLPESLRSFMIEKRYAIILQIEKDRHWQDEYGIEVRFNPYDLKDVQFAKAIDPYTAFQELSMWVGGVLGGQSPEVVEITDNRTLIEKHGFDNVISFRGPRL